MQGERGTGGFTLIELLVVIAILGVLATAVVLVINPAELLKQGRDSTRLSDLASLQSALSLFQTDRYDQGLGTASTTYISIPDTSPTCADLGLPSLPAGWSYHCAPPATYTKTDGSGWIPVNFSLISSGSPLSKLPIDPVNTTSSGLYYTYVAGGSYQIASHMESSKYTSQEAASGGPDPALYVVGSDTNLAPFVGGLVGYWSFNEGAGMTAYDSSGYGNNGTMYSSSVPTDLHVSSGCISGSCGSFNGVNEYVQIPPASVLNVASSSYTIAAWEDSLVSQNWQTVYITFGSYQIRMFIHPQNFYFVTRINGVIKTFYSNNLTVSQWHFIAATRNYSSGTFTFYVDGNAVSSFTAPGVSDTVINSVSIGGYPNTVNPFNGMIDDVRIYNRVLSAAEISAMYNAER